MSGQTKAYDLDERLLDFSADIIRLTERVPRTRAGTHVAGQLLRCGTSPLPNHGEAQDAESIEDFIHKFKICLKELREVHRWLRLIKRVPLIRPESQVNALLDETEQLIRIFKTSVKTAEKRKASRVGLRRSVQRSEFDVQSSEFRSSI